MVKLSRPSSLGRNRSANANGNAKSSHWTKPVEFNRISSSKRWSFRQTESTGGESEFTLTRDTSKSKSPSKSRSKSKEEPTEFTRAGESFNRVASAADAFLATGTFEYDSEDDISRTRSGGSAYKLRKSFSLTNSRKGSALSSATTDDRNDDGSGGADDNFWNPFSGMFGEEGRDADDDCSQFTYDSASQMSAGTEQTGATDLRPQNLNSVAARDGSFLNAFARSVSNHLNPDHSIGEEVDDEGDEDEVEDLDDDSRYHLETRSSGRDSSYYSTDDEDASSWDDHDDDTRRTNPHSFDGGEESETEVGVSKPTAAAASDSKSKAPDAEYLYQFSSRVRIDDGSSEESKKATESKEVQDATCEPPATAAEPTKTKKSRGRALALKKIVPKFRSSKKSTKSDPKSALTKGANAQSEGTSPPRSKVKKQAFAATKQTQDTENEAALREMMESARHVAAEEEGREAVDDPKDGHDGDDDVQSLDSLEYSQYSRTPTVASNRTTRSSRSFASMSAKRSERKDAARIKKEIRNRDKAREATLRRMEAEERKRLKAEKREAEIAAANAKEAEARAKLAALIAEAKLKKQQEEIAAERRANAKKEAEKAQKEEQLEVTKDSEGTTPQEAAPAKAIPLAARAQSVEERVLRAADAVDLFLATGRLGAPWSPREQDTEEPSPPPPPPRPQQSRVPSRTSPKPTTQYSEDVVENDMGNERNKSFARARSLPRRTRSLSRPRNLFGKKKKDQLDASEEEETEEFAQEEEEPFDVNIFKKKQAMKQPNEAISRNITRPPSIEIEEEDFSDSEESGGYSEESSYLSEDVPMDERPPPPRRSAVSDLLSQPPVSPLLPPLPASPQHSVSSRSMATYDPTAPSSPRSIGSEHHKTSSFVRSTTYRPGDISVSEELRPSALRRQPSPKRSVSFKRPDDVRNDVIAEEDIECVIEQNMNDMALQTNQKLSPRAAGSRNTFCIHEYDDEGHQAVVYNSFGNDPIRSLRIFEYDNPPRIKRSSCDVLVKIQASTVSYSDCAIRQGKWWGSDKMAPPITPGVDFVGKISSVGDEAVDMYGYSPGDTVASLVRCGGNARYAVIDASKLIDVPDDVEPTSAACMLETYLAAFQSLHLDEPEETRYEKTSMLGKNVLIIGGIVMIGQAMIELAFLAGASTVYVTAREKHHDFLRSLGAVPLSMNVEEWVPSVKGRMNLIVDAYCTNHYSETADALDPNGKMVCIRTKTSMLRNDPGILWQAEAFLTKMGMSPLSQTFTYDVYESWEENIDLCKDDMVHLFDLLRKGLVEPPIADCIPLTKVPQAQKIFETKRIQGFFVCEPWLKKKQKAGFC